MVLIGSAAKKTIITSDVPLTESLNVEIDNLYMYITTQKPLYPRIGTYTGMYVCIFVGT